MSTMSTPDNPLIDAARGRDLVHERGCPALGGYGHGKEACACSAEETQAHKLRTLAAAADKHGQHTYTHWRDSNAAKANEAWCQAASPELVVGLLDRITELEAKEINIEQFRVMVTEAARNPLLKRIVDLETQLAAEAARTAAEKLRADQMSQQHDMQAAMNREARQALAAGAGLMPLSKDQVMQCWEKATGEQPERMPPGWLKFAREIEASQGRDTSKLPWCEALEASDIKIHGWPKL